MTHTQTQYNETDVNLYQESERTSVMAILSMVFGIGGCCLGVTSLPAILLGIFGLIGISRSKGRVGGTGFGIAGILIGLLTLALWLGAIGVSVGGLNTFIGTFGQSTEQMFLDVQADNFDSARSQMNSPGADATDAQFAVFHAGYTGTLGEYVSLPDGPWDMMKGYMAVGEQIQPYNGQQGLIPMPLRFDSGWGLVIIIIDPQGGPSSSGVPMAIEYIVVDSQGNEYRLPGDAADDQADAAESVIEDIEESVPADDDGP